MDFMARRTAAGAVLIGSKYDSYSSIDGSISAKRNITWTIFMRGSALYCSIRHLEKFCKPPPPPAHPSRPRRFAQHISIGNREKEAD
jgi:hypothetical protein